MKILLCVLISIGTFTPTVARKCVFKGMISGFPDQTLVVLTPYKSTGPGDVDREITFHLNNGSFEIELAVEVPTYYSLRNRPENPLEFENLNFWIESGTLTLTGKRGELEFAHITGSPVQDEYEQYIRSHYKERKRIKDMRDSVLSHPDLSASVRTRLSGENRRLQSMISAADLQFIHDHTGSYISASLLSFYCNYRPDLMSVEKARVLYSGFSDVLKKSAYAEPIEKFINGNVRYDPPGIGDVPREFSLPDAKGGAVSLSSFKERIVLLDFWASWCAPCRAEHKNYLRIYEQSHDRGFEIVSVSQDANRKHWIDAVQKDQMKWISLLDSTAAITRGKYSILGIPSNYLIDDSGHIIAINITGKELAKRVEDLLSHKSSDK